MLACQASTMNLMENRGNAIGVQHANDVNRSMTKLGDPAKESNDNESIPSINLLGEDYNEFKQNQVNDVTLQRLWGKC